MSEVAAETPQLGKGERAQRIMISGEPFRLLEVSKQVGGTASTAYLRRREAEVLGYHFTELPDGYLRCSNPGHQPSQYHKDRLFEHRRETNPGAYDPEYRRARLAKAKAKTRALPPAQRISEAEREQQRLAAQARVQAREDRERQAREAATNGHNLSLFADPGASMLGMPFDAELRSIANGSSNGDQANGVLATPPQLGGNLQVFAMVIRDDGTLRLGLQTGERRWMVDVVGEVPR